MKYFKADDKLIQFNVERSIYRIRNSVEKGDKTITEDDFNKLGATQIKHQKFCELMNIYFKDIKHEWIYNNVNYRKLDNFDYNSNSSSFNLNNIPRHNVGSVGFDHILVYHWGQIYYACMYYEYYPKVQLINPKTLDTVRWADIKHLAPIFNVDNKTIV